MKLDDKVLEEFFKNPQMEEKRVALLKMLDIADNTLNHKSELIGGSKCGNGNEAFYYPESNYPKARTELKLGAIKNMINHIKDVYSPTGSMVAVNVVGSTLLTKDGSSFFDSLIFEDPASLLVHGLIRQGAEFILQNSKDGTTSVALLSCLLAEKLIMICDRYEQEGIVISKQKVKDICVHIQREYSKLVMKNRVKIDLTKLEEGNTDYNLILDVCRTSMNDEDSLDSIYVEILKFIIDNKVEPKDITFKIKEELTTGKSSLNISRAYKIMTKPICDNTPFALSNVPIIRLDDPFVNIEDNSMLFEFVRRLSYVSPNGAVIMMGVIPPGFKDWHASFVTNAEAVANKVRFIHQPLIGEGNYEIQDIDKIVNGLNMKILEVKDANGVVKSSPTIDGLDSQAMTEFYVTSLKNLLAEKNFVNVAFNGTHLSISPENGDYTVYDEISEKLESQLNLVDDKDSDSAYSIKKRLENLKSFWFETTIRSPHHDEAARLRTAYDDATGALVSAITEGLVSGGNTFLVKFKTEFVKAAIAGLDNNKLIPSPKYLNIAMELIDAYISSYHDLMELIYGKKLVDSIWETLLDSEDPLLSYDVLKDTYNKGVLEPAMTTVVVNEGATLAANSINMVARVKGVNLDHSAQLNQYNKYSKINY